MPIKGKPEEQEGQPSFGSHDMKQVQSKAPFERVRSYEDFKAVISERYPTLSRQLQGIAHHVLEKPEELAFNTVASVAQQIQVQPSSIVRFAKALGFEGYTDMQRVFRERLIAHSSSYRERIHSLHQTREGESGGLGQIVDDFVDQGIASLNLLRANTAPGKMETAIELLAEAEEIYLLAQRRAFPVAFYLAYALSRLERRCHLLDGVGGLLQQQAALASPRDVVFAVSFHPYTPAVIEVARERSEKDVPIIAITDSALSPLARFARLSFEIKEPEDLGFRSLVAPMCLAQILVVGLGNRLAKGPNESAGR